ncbi:MAG: ABC transporter permease [Planctomycetota bacterium]|nr:ABC transporter permease [Planctomycetota bacterium]
MTDWTIVARSLRVRLFSTCTTVLIVALGVALMVVLLTLRDAGRSSFERGTGNVHLLVSRDASPLASVLNGLFYASSPPRPLRMAEYEKIASLPPVEWAIPVQLGDSYRGAYPVLATTPEFFAKFQPAQGAAWRFADGRAFAKDFEVVVGASAARATGLRLGDSVVLTHGTGGSRAGGHVHDEFAYAVVGVLEPTGTIHDRALFTNLQSSWLIHAFDRLERAGGHDDHDHEGHDHAGMPIGEEDLTDADRLITNIYLRVLTRPGSDVSASVPVVMETIRRDPAFVASPLTVAGPLQEIRRLMAIVGNIDQILVAMAAAVMIVSSVGILLALYNSMEQRRRQIAILRVLGASAGRIFSLVMTESAIIGLCGALLGLALGYAGSHLTAGVMRARLGLVIEPALPLNVPATILLMTLGLACLAGLVPAVVAYRTGVAKNLRPAA